ncbi:MAG: HAMP domain-containing histidine kinase [Ectothiorhodospiraceae bacterium]|nr:HAMP domain-containing histidine kinase [Ectothiorhodospiraceae bacterium]
MRRLYVQIYVSLLAALAICVVLGSLAWVALGRSAVERARLDGLAELVDQVLPSADAPPARLAAQVERLHRRLRLDVTVLDADGTPLAAAGRPIRPPRWLAPGAASRVERRGRAFVAALALDDGRWVLARTGPRLHGPGWLWALGLLAVAAAAAAYPVARRLTRRLERLEAQAAALAAGDLSARVVVDGRDEVARLAASFNRAAERIERLVAAKRDTLAAASHELRTPLARLRVAVELATTDPSVRESVARDIAELDSLIDELLLASRLDAGPDLDRKEPVDLLALAAEEAARREAEVAGEPVEVSGDPRLLRRLVRNLVENAHRHGAPPVTVEVRASSAKQVRLTVTDAGPGIPAEARERIFEPFYRAPGARAETGRGVGLGLALVRQIARHHGGEARCGDGPGTVIEVTLPRSRPA